MQNIRQFRQSDFLQTSYNQYNAWATQHGDFRKFKPPYLGKGLNALNQIRHRPPKYTLQPQNTIG